MNLKDEVSGKVFHLVGDCADALGLTTCIVGGYVRDILLQRKSKDIDFVAEGSGIELAKSVAEHIGKGAHVAVYATYGTAQVRYGKMELEFVGARKESYKSDSRNPIVESGTLAEDLSRRDFTVNAMAISVNKADFGEVIDPFDGLSDLKRKILRTPLDPDVTFSDDPLRMMRAVRFASQLNFCIYPDTFEAIKRNAERIKIITKERINDELSKILCSPRPSVGFRLLDETGLLPLIFPELCLLKGVENVENLGHKDNFNHTLQVLDNVAARSDKEWLRWAALLHDIGKPATKKFEPGRGWTFRNHNFIGEKMIPRIFRSMKLPMNEKMKYVAKLVGMHMQPQAVGEEQVTDRAIRRMSKEAGEDLEDLMILAEADITSKNKAKVQRILENFQYVRSRLKEVSSKDDWREWENPINGNMIMAVFGLKQQEQGKVIGSLREEIKDEIYCVPEKENFDYAYDFMLSLAEKYGITPLPGVDKEQIRLMVKHRKPKE